MIERLGAAPVSFRGLEVDPRGSYEEKIVNNNRIQTDQNSLQQSMPNQYQAKKLDVIA